MSTLIEKIAPTIPVNHQKYPIELINYKHEGVIGKFRDEWDVEVQEAEDIFLEMKKFLFISDIAHRQCIDIEIDEPTLMIDKMWHQFILFTNDYEIFCQRFFGRTLHHKPFCAAHLAQQLRTLAQGGISLNDYKRNRLQTQLDFINDAVGSDTVRKWYVTYGNKYSPEKINALQRPVFHDLQKLSTSMEEKDAIKLTSKELITGIIKHISPSMYCGGSGCGVYCSCNSSKATPYS